MLTRLWFALSVLWAALFFIGGPIPNPGRPEDAQLALLPLAAGILVKLVARYVVTGSLR